MKETFLLFVNAFKKPIQTVMIEKPFFCNFETNAFICRPSADVTIDFKALISSHRILPTSQFGINKCFWNANNGIFP